MKCFAFVVFSFGFILSTSTRNSKPETPNREVILAIASKASRPQTQPTASFNQPTVDCLILNSLVGELRNIAEITPAKPRLPLRQAKKTV